MPAADYLQDDTPDVMHPEDDDYDYQRRLDRLQRGAFGIFDQPRRPMDERPDSGYVGADENGPPVPAEANSDYIGPGGGMGEDVMPDKDQPPTRSTAGYVGPGGGMGEDVGPEEPPESGRGGGGMGGTITPTTPGETAGIARAVAPAPASPGIPQGPNYEQLSKVYGQMPVMKPTKWWERLAAGALGAGAGWSNAASRTRNPIDIGAMSQAVLHPGYQQRLAEWQSRVAPVEAQAKIASEQQGAFWKNQQAQAQAQYLRAHADYMKGLGRGAYIDVTPEMEKETGGIFKVGMRIPGSTATEIARITAGKYEKQEKLQTFRVTDPDIAKRIGVAPGTDVPLSLYQEALRPVPQKAERSLTVADVRLNPGKYTPEQVAIAKQMWAESHRPPQGRGGRQGTSTQYKQVEQKKGERLINARKLAEAQLDKESDEDARQNILNQLTDTEQLIQNSYEDEIEGLGGSSEHYEVPPETNENFLKTQAAPPKQTAQTAAPKTPATVPPPPKQGSVSVVSAQHFTEADARALAKKRNLDPDAFVATARNRGLIK
jgi:hypothetical protein